jgi:hypothetical protein
MENQFSKGDIVRAKRALIKKLLHFPISRSEIMTVIDTHEVKYAGEDSSSIGVTVKDVDGNIHHFSQDNLEKL